MSFSPDMGGPGQLLPPPQLLYPAYLNNMAELPGDNEIVLAPGQSVTIPRGRYLVIAANNALIQILDPVSGGWRTLNTAARTSLEVISDGFNYRVANLTSCPVGAVITNGGSAANYVQATTTVTPSTGNSKWQPIIGGQVSTTATIDTAGSGYGMPPLCYIPAPPAPGLPAVFKAAITNGTVSSLTCIDQGAGYPTAPTITLLPNPYDPNFLAGASITQATAHLTLVAASGSASAGKLTGLVCTNSGVSQATMPTLTIAGAGSSAAATVVPLWTATGMSITAAGATVSATNELTSVGGRPSNDSVTPAWTNPDYDFTNYIPRKASMLLAIGSGSVSSVSAIYDGGLFTGTPEALVLGAAVTAPTLTFVLGGSDTTVFIQPLG